MKKIVIVHDSFVDFGGAESVALKIKEIFPYAELITGQLNKRNFEEFTKMSSYVFKKIPSIINTNGILGKLYILFFWESLNLTDFDVVISSSDVLSSKTVLTRPDTLHVCYCHTPPKYLYLQSYQEFGYKKLVFLRGLVIPSLLRLVDYITAQRPDIMIANSQTVAARIRKYYRRDSVVIYPPVHVPSQLSKNNYREDYYIHVGRLERSKNIDLIIKACNQLGKRLIIIGDGRQKQTLRRLCSDCIEMLGYVSEKEKQEYIQKAKGFIFAGKDEDFGIAPVEAMGEGTPVIAYYSGGVRESVIEGKTGIFFREHTVESLKSAIERFERGKFSRKACHDQAKKFSEDRFKRQFISLVTKAYEEKQAEQFAKS